ncbi:MAG: NAD-binding protein [Candidatus Omnitrophica bacterium]|nr:NAD-binding protein [Candidatus Omnitrophota bacterium]
MYIIVVGCSRVGVTIAQSLESEGHSVVVVDRSRENLQKLGRSFSGITVVGNGFAPEVLKEAGIERADVLLAVTDSDNANIVCAQVAQKLFNLKRVFARIYDPARAATYQKMGVEIISETQLVVDALKEKVFAKG